MLFTDADWLTTNDLRDEDRKLVEDTASAEQINLPRCISSAIDDAGAILLNEMKSFSVYSSREGVPSAHYDTIFNAVRNSPQTRLVLQQVVVDSTDGQRFGPIKKWVLHLALQNAYRGALNNNLIDRYVARVEFEEKEIRNKYHPRVFNDGIPVVFLPLSRPAASRDALATGSWDSSNVSAVAGTGMGGSYDVAITWVDQAGPEPRYLSYRVPGNAESAPSDLAQVACTASQNIQVDISSLIPPSGIPPLELLSIFTPRSATGWNIYCGAQGSGVLRLQNPAPIPFSTKVFSFLPIGGYAAMPTGQRRDDKMMMVSRFGRV